MSDPNNNKYSAPSGPPPTYGSQVQHHDAGPYNQNQNQLMDPRAPEQAYSGYNSPPPMMGPGGGGGGGGGGYYYNNPNGYNNGYNNANYGPPPQGYYAPNQPQQGYYGPPQQQQGMYYQQQGPYGQGQPPMGYYQDNRGTSAAEGCCGALLGALACCCCLELLF